MAKQSIDSKDDAKEKKNKLKEKIGEVLEKKDELKEKKDELKEKRDELKEKIGELKEKNDELKEKKDKLKEKKGELKEEEDLKEKIEDIMLGKVDDINNSIGEIKVQKHDIMEKKDELKEKKDELKEEEDLKEKIEDIMLGKVDDINNSIGEIKVQKHDIMEKKDELKEEKKEQKEKTENIIVNNKKQIDDMMKKKDKLKEEKKVQKAKTENIIEKRDDIVNNKEQIDDIMKKKDELKEEEKEQKGKTENVIEKRDDIVNNKEQIDDIMKKKDELKEEEKEQKEKTENVIEKSDDIVNNKEQIGDIRGNEDELKTSVEETGDVSIEETGKDVSDIKLTEDLTDNLRMENAINVKSLNTNPVIEEKGKNLQPGSSPEQGSMGGCEATGYRSDCIHDPAELTLTTESMEGVCEKNFLSFEKNPSALDKEEDLYTGTGTTDGDETTGQGSDCTRNPGELTLTAESMGGFGDKIPGAQNFEEEFLKNNLSAQNNEEDLYRGTMETDEKVGQDSTTEIILPTEKPECLEVGHEAQKNRKDMCPENSSANKPNVQPAAENGTMGREALSKRTEKHKLCRKKKKENEKIKNLGDPKLPDLPEIIVLLIRLMFSALISVRWNGWLRFLVPLLSICVTSSSLCSSCQIHEFCTGEDLLNQPLTISKAGKENFCSFQFTGHSLTAKCNELVVELSETRKCVLLYVPGLVYKDLFLEYGTGRTPPVPVALAGCCDNSPIGSSEANYSRQISAPPPTQSFTREPVEVAIIVPILIVGFLLIILVVYIYKRKRPKQGAAEHVGNQTDQRDVAIEMGRLGAVGATGDNHEPDKPHSNGEIVRVNQENLRPGGGAVSVKESPEEDRSEHNGDTVSPVGIPVQENPEMDLGTSSCPGETAPRDGVTEPLLIHKETHRGVRNSNENSL
ncbi:titin homolog isoform X3 [Xenopus tropicalis]|uniref:Titin homolog isoform X3 n=1 Tax=Xenopus tropicalis TaxID=8364 RepID=A0A8J1JMI6_XENTR|nr:titin homolog isoform X3 [Xenopus tropicalis]